MATFLSDSIISDHLKDILGKATTETMEAHWTSVVARSNLAAYGFLRRSLAARGFSPAQFAAWDDGAEFNLDLACWWALVKGGIARDFAVEEFVKLYDRREELKDLILTTNGVVVAPEGPAGQVTTGPMDTSEDLFVMDVDDDRRGVPTIL